MKNNKKTPIGICPDCGTGDGWHHEWCRLPHNLWSFKSLEDLGDFALDTQNDYTKALSFMRDNDIQVINGRWSLILTNPIIL